MYIIIIILQVVFVNSRFVSFLDVFTNVVHRVMAKTLIFLKNIVI